MKKVFRKTSLLLAAVLMGSTGVQAQKSPQDMDRFIDALMKKMTVEEMRKKLEELPGEQIEVTACPEQP